ncbi:hypothetical protein Nepgr_009917 [Nepenthes gracilis]|uniref:Uncharacterized protein n=1 Tax=Nepenthes gracilis TaxID=150966 RepID=A0AAD3SBK9_NEPGR|nr:hypothetical protein Nepgr_009917 [Nepenthes gracilis]
MDEIQTDSFSDLSDLVVSSSSSLSVRIFLRTRSSHLFELFKFLYAIATPYCYLVSAKPDANIFSDIGPASFKGGVKDELFFLKEGNFKLTASDALANKLQKNLMNPSHGESCYQSLFILAQTLAFLPIFDPAFAMNIRRDLRRWTPPMAVHLSLCPGTQTWKFLYLKSKHRTAN